MPLPRRRRIAACLFAALLMDAGVAAVSSLPAGAARSAATAGSAVAAKAKAVATLAILNPSVSVRRKGKDEFTPATDGQKLRVGDTVQTDGTGFAQVSYTDDSFTRLDVDTTFTIESLTDDVGNRKIKASVEAGRTWNRTSALAETESFEQEGAGATAAVVGSAFVTDITSPGIGTFTSLIDGLQLTTEDGELQQLDPLQACGAKEISESDADLCDVIAQLTVDAALADPWNLLNFFLDGLAGFPGLVVTQHGNVISVTQVPPPTSASNQEAPAAAPPDINDDDPVLVEDCGFAFPGGVCAGAAVPNPDFPAEGLYTQNNGDVYFKINATPGPSGLPYSVVFVAVPDADFGFIWDHVADTVVETGHEYASDTLFRFAPDVADLNVETDTNTLVQVVNADSASEPVEIPITVNNNV